MVCGTVEYVPAPSTIKSKPEKTEPCWPAAGSYYSLGIRCKRRINRFAGLDHIVQGFFEYWRCEEQVFCSCPFISSSVGSRDISMSLRLRCNRDSERSSMGDSGIIGRYGLSASMLLKANPNHHGKVLKLHIPTLFLFLPKFLRRILMLSRCCKLLPFSSTIVPSWIERELILLGNFVYRFEDDHSIEPKGTPIPMDSTNTNVITLSRIVPGVLDGFDMNTIIKATLPLGYKGFFVIDSNGGDKVHYFATTTEEDALIWVNSLLAGRKECITRKMGHAGQIPYPTSWKMIDNLGEDLFKRKERVKNKLRTMEANEFELSNSGSLPRGYYG